MCFSFYLLQFVLNIMFNDLIYTKYFKCMPRKYVYNHIDLCRVFIIILNSTLYVTANYVIFESIHHWCVYYIQNVVLIFDVYRIIKYLI